MRENPPRGGAPRVTSDHPLCVERDIAPGHTHTHIKIKYTHTYIQLVANNLITDQ